MKIEKEIVLALINEGATNRADFRRVVASVYRNHNTKGYHANIKLREEYDKMVQAGEIDRNEGLEKLLITKRLRSASGVSVITVLTKPYECPGKCIYCPDEKNVPKSYLSNEPAVMRAILADYDPLRQVETRLKSLQKQGHPVDKVELIVIGGTFSYLPRDYQESFIKSCFDALNNSKSDNLLDAQQKNEKAKARCVGLTLETRPDYINAKEVEWFRYLGATRVELGVQSVFDDVLAANCRGHKVAETISATKLLKDAGFKICYHLMPNLYKSDLKRDLEMFETVFEHEGFKPDYIKIYPTMVTEGTALFDLWQKGEYKSYSDDELVELICSVKETVPYWIRIMRTIRDIPGTEIISGSKTSNLRQVVLEKLKSEGKTCRCIRCREVGLINEPRNKEQGVELFVDEYQASGGIEYFLSYESSDRKTLYSLLRLRLTSGQVLGEIKGAALIREVHTYGQEVEVGGSSQIQHTGYGKALLVKAEKIAKENGYKKIAVIAGIGAREYYRKFGYEIEGTYLIKTLDK
jgi:elongator complex protein 3